MAHTASEAAAIVVFSLDGGILLVCSLCFVVMVANESLLRYGRCALVMMLYCVFVVCVFVFVRCSWLAVSCDVSCDIFGWLMDMRARPQNSDTPAGRLMMILRICMLATL